MLLRLPDNSVISSEHLSRFHPYLSKFGWAIRFEMTTGTFDIDLGKDSKSVANAKYHDLIVEMRELEKLGDPLCESWDLFRIWSKYENAENS
jgi:hypothetical protein